MPRLQDCNALSPSNFFKLYTPHNVFLSLMPSINQFMIAYTSDACIMPLLTINNGRLTFFFRLPTTYQNDLYDRKGCTSTNSQLPGMKRTILSLNQSYNRTYEIFFTTVEYNNQFSQLKKMELKNFILHHTWIFNLVNVVNEI